MLLQEALKQRTVVIYGGRFQPMGNHHYIAYQGYILHLIQKKWL